MGKRCMCNSYVSHYSRNMDISMVYRLIHALDLCLTSTSKCQTARENRESGPHDGSDLFSERNILSLGYQSGFPMFLLSSR